MGFALLVPMLNTAEPLVGTPNANPVDLPPPGVLGEAEAPPKDSDGADPPGPNLPSLAGGVEDETLSRLAEGENDFDSGVAG